MFGSNKQNFAGLWGAEEDFGTFKVRRGRGEPLKHRIAMATYRINSMVSRLDSHIGRLEERDKVLFDKIVESAMAKDKTRAAMYANEVAEIRKVTRSLLMTRTALEQVSLRLETIGDLGDVFASLGPIVGVISALKTTIKGVMPAISMEISEIGESLQEVMSASGEFTGSAFLYQGTSPEARKILDEAAAVADQKMKENFPALPSDIARELTPKS